MEHSFFSLENSARTATIGTLKFQVTYDRFPRRVYRSRSSRMIWVSQSKGIGFSNFFVPYCQAPAPPR